MVVYLSARCRISICPMFAVICNGKHFPRKTQTPTELCRFIRSADFKISKATAACAVTSSERRRLGDGRYCREQETLAALSRFVDFPSVSSPPVLAVPSLVSPSASLTACLGDAAVLDWVLVLLGRGVFISLPFFLLLVRRLFSFILLGCLCNSKHRIYIKKIWLKIFLKEAFYSLLLIVKTQMRVWYHWWKKRKQQKQKTKTNHCGEDFYDLKYYSFYNYWTLFCTVLIIIILVSQNW